MSKAILTKGLPDKTSILTKRLLTKPFRIYARFVTCNLQEVFKFFKDEWKFVCNFFVGLPNALINIAINAIHLHFQVKRSWVPRRKCACQACKGKSFDMGHKFVICSQQTVKWKVAKSCPSSLGDKIRLNLSPTSYTSKPSKSSLMPSFLLLKNNVTVQIHLLYQIHANVWDARQGNLFCTQ